MLTKRCFAVFRIVGQPWSIIMRLNCADVRDYLRPADGAAMSMALKARAIVVTSGDTSGIYQYVTFEKGKAVEIFDVGSTASGADRAAAAKQFSDWYKVDFSRFKNVQVAGGLAAASSLRKLPMPKGGKSLEFIGDYVRGHNAFVPFFGEEWGGAGDRAELTIEGLGADDVERLDYVAVT